MNYIKLLLIPALLSLVTISSPSKATDVKDTNYQLAEEPAPQVMCYEAAAPVIKPDNVNDLNKQLQKVETLYKNNKIDKDTYQIRKNDLTKKINTLQAE
ncbi:MAG: hypothetical protein AB1782_11655 [Cyanobacteriota bacterium]